MNAVFDAIQLLKNGELMFPAFETAFKQMSDNLELYRKAGVSQNLLVMGESGTGKSTLAMMFANCHPKQVLLAGDVIPVLYVSVPAAATIAGTVESVLRRLGDPQPSQGTVSVKTARAVQLVRGCHVEMMLFDEAQHIQDRGRSQTQYFVGDWLKAFIDELGLPVTLLGLPRTEGLLQVNEQLRRRFTHRLSLSFRQDDVLALAENSLQLLIGLASSLPLRVNPQPFGWKELGLRLQFATDCRIAYVKQLLVGAFQRATELGDTEITVDALAYAFTDAIWPAGIDVLNPFHPNFVMRRLDRQGEPFQSGTLDGSVRQRGRK